MKKKISLARSITPEAESKSADLLLSNFPILSRTLGARMNNKLLTHTWYAKCTLSVAIDRVRNVPRTLSNKK